MACKKSELVAAINSYASARVTGDNTLQAFSAQRLEQFIETLEFATEEVNTEKEEEVAS